MNFDIARETFYNIINAQIHKDVIVLVLLHKNDEPDGMDRNQFIKDFGLLDLPYKWACYETSAKTGENIFEGFRWFFDQLKDEVG